MVHPGATIDPVASPMSASNLESGAGRAEAAALDPPVIATCWPGFSGQWAATARDLRHRSEIRSKSSTVTRPTLKVGPARPDAFQKLEWSWR